MSKEPVIRQPTPFGFDVTQKTYFLSEELAKLSEEDVKDARSIVSTLLNTLGKVHDLQLKQSLGGFRFAIIGSVIGLAFLIGSIIYMLINGIDFASGAAFVSGALIELIAALILSIFKQTSDRLERTQIQINEVLRFLLADDIVEKLDKENKDQVRSDIVRSLIKIDGNKPQIDDLGSDR